MEEKGVEHRAFTRRRVNIMCGLEIDGQTSQAKIVNASEHGFLLQTDTLLPQDVPLGLTLEMDSGEDFSVKCQAIHGGRYLGANGNFWGLGVAIEEIPPALQEHILAILEDSPEDSEHRLVLEEYVGIY